MKKKEKKPFIPVKCGEGGGMAGGGEHGGSGRSRFAVPTLNLATSQKLKSLNCFCFFSFFHFSNAPSNL